MSFDTEFLTLMPSTVSVKELVSVNSYGDPTYSTGATSYRALVEQKPTLIRNFSGEEVVAMYTVYVASTEALSPTSFYTLPNGDTPEVQSITVAYDEDGIHHNVLYLGGGG